MKISKTGLFGVFLAFYIAAMAGCSQSSVADDAGTRVALDVSVSNTGYTPFEVDKEGHSLKTQDNPDYTTTFTPGDKIGVYRVLNHQIQESNLCLEAVKNPDGSINWQPVGQAFLKLRAGTYYAYYPYQSQDVGPNPSADKAEDFFASLIKKWDPGVDQSSQSAYTQKDLMVAQGTLTGKTLSFNMTHQMALVALNFLASSGYHFSDKTIPPYVIASPPPVVIHQIKPWKSNDNLYRFLLNPAADSKMQTITGGYQSSAFKWGITLDWSVYGVKKSSVYTYRIDPGIVIDDLILTLQPGDYLYRTQAGKWMVSPGYPNAPIPSIGTCIGVVFKVGKDASGPNVDTGTYTSKDGNPMTVHGYAVALFDSNANSQQKGQVCIWSTNTTQAVGTSKSQTDFLGYSNTQTIKKAGGTGEALKTKYPACYWTAVDYETKYSAPSNSSGWFFPSCGQLKFLYDKKGTYVSSITQAGGQTWQGQWYWSSSEFSTHPTSDAWFVLFVSGGVSNYRKPTNSYVRALVAF